MPALNELKGKVDITCTPTKICIKIDSTWFNLGIPNSIIEYGGMPFEFSEFIDPSDGVDVAGVKFPPYMSPRFVQSAFVSELLPNMACPVIDQRLLTENSVQYWSGCVSIDVATPCFKRTIDANNTRAMFQTWFETRNTEVKTNYAFPLQCSYHLNYNVDLYLGLVTYDENGIPIFNPNNKNYHVNCGDQVSNNGAVVKKELCQKDGTNVPGFFRPLFDLQNITLITTSATDKGSFPVYLLEPGLRKRKM